MHGGAAERCEPIALNGALRHAPADPAVVKRTNETSATATPGSAADFGAFVRKETAKWTKVIKTANSRPD